MMTRKKNGDFLYWEISDYLLTWSLSGRTLVATDTRAQEIRDAFITYIKLFQPFEGELRLINFLRVFDKDELRHIAQVVELEEFTVFCVAARLTKK